MDRLFTLAVTCLVAAGLALAWDRHPPVDIPLGVGPLTVHLRLPKSLAQARDEAVAEAARHRASVDACAGSLGRQNAALAGLEAEAGRRLAAAEDARQAALRARPATAARIERLAVPAVGADACARMFDADDKVLEAFR